MLECYKNVNNFNFWNAIIIVKTEVLVLPLDVSRRSFGISVKIFARDSPCYRPRGLEAAVPEIVRLFAVHDTGTAT